MPSVHWDKRHKGMLVDLFTSWKEICGRALRTDFPDTWRADSRVLIASALHWPLCDLGQGCGPHISIAKRRNWSFLPVLVGARAISTNWSVSHITGATTSKVTHTDCSITTNKQICYHVVFSKNRWMSLKPPQSPVSLWFLFGNNWIRIIWKNQWTVSEMVYFFALRKPWTLFCVLEHVTRLRCFPVHANQIICAFPVFSWETVWACSLLGQSQDTWSSPGSQSPIFILTEEARSNEENNWGISLMLLFHFFLLP